MSDRDALAADLHRAADALDLARKHCLIAIDHLDAGELARVGAHSFAARGDLVRGLAALDTAATNFAAHSSTSPPAR